jgi:NTP pyrophosphatase (non-canonical NTP hydrolase)
MGHLALGKEQMKTGDTVYHEPTGETWVVAFVEGGDIYPCGWPCTRAKVKDCNPQKTATAAESQRLIEQMAAIQESDPRRDWAQRELKRQAVEARLAAMDTLNFRDFRRVNRERCEKAFHRINEWSENDWATATAGELGELCNLLKKRRRGEAVPTQLIESEAADVFTYLDLLCERMEIDLGAAVRRKFNEVSERKKCSVRLSTWYPPLHSKMVSEPPAEPKP